MPRRRMNLGLAFAGLVVFTLVVIGWPAVVALWGVARAGPGAPVPVAFPPGLLLASVGWAGVIALAATALAWPGAWAIRRWGWRAAPIVAAPLLLPPYLAYAGWNLLRAPDTWLGGLIERAAGDGHRWVPLAVGRVLAIGGLAVWAAPLAAMALAVTLRRIDDDVLGQLRLDAGERALRHRARLALPGLAGAFVLVLLLMLGSAVPLHLAQVPTWSIRLWAGLDLLPPGEHGRVWARAWPSLVLGVAGVMLLRSVVRPDAAIAQVPRGGPGAGAMVLALAAPVLGVVIPLVLFAGHVRSAGSLATFWRISGPAVAQGLMVAAVVGGVSMAVVVLVWGAFTARAGRATSAMVMGLAVAALLPGVLVGSVVARAWGWSAWVSETWVVVVLAHLARFGAVAGLAGAWLYSSEAVEERDLRAVDGAVSVGGWLGACWPAHRGVILGSGLAAGVLSFFEIESSVVVQPPGMESLSRQLLGYLHFARTDEMSAAAVMLLTAGLAAGAAAGWLAGRADVWRGRR